MRTCRALPRIHSKETNLAAASADLSLRTSCSSSSTPSAESLDALQSPHDSESAGWEAPDTTARDPSQEVVERELREKVMEAVQELPEAQRTAVILCRYEGLSYEEIAQVLGCSVSATKSLLHRARLTLKEKLRGYY